METHTSAVILVKLKKGSADAMIKHVIDSYRTHTSKYYNVRDQVNTDKILPLSKTLSYWCLFIIYEQAVSIKTMYWGKGLITEQGNINYEMICSSQNPLIVNNFASYIELDLDKDFKDAQVHVEFSPELIGHMQFIGNGPKKLTRREVQIKPREDEARLSPLAQRNQYCMRQCNVTEPVTTRSEFQRDYDRIVHSKAFRRLADKAQIFTASKGDYYRNRMTHSLIVGQISKSICTQLGLNPFLTDAIALGHDLGHTPFGHQGERTLNDILTGKIGKKKNPLPEEEYGTYGGFKHNYQGLRVVSLLEEAYLNVEGLDLSIQTMEGFLKHTGLKDYCDINEFLPPDLVDKMYMEYPFSVTLEGQAVAIADEIAQRCHDLDDAFSANLITIDDLLTSLGLHKTRSLHDSFFKIKENIEREKRQGKQFVDTNELLHETISSVVVDYFVNDVITASTKRIRDYGDFKTDSHIVDERLIWFTDDGETLCKYLNKIITKRVINGLEVSQFDSRGNDVVLGLFCTYYRNPKLLHMGTLRRIYIEQRKSKLQNIIDFQTGDFNLIRDEWGKITGGPSCKPPDMSDEYVLKRKILVRAICDFIAGMTDTYALTEYQKIYAVSPT